MTLRLLCILALAGLPLATLLPAQGRTSTAVALAAPGQRVSGTGWTTSALTWVALVRGAEGSRLESVNPRAIPVEDPHTGGRGTSIVTGGRTCWRTSVRITQEIGLCCSSHAVLGLGISSGWRAVSTCREVEHTCKGRSRAAGTEVPAIRRTR
jgi:hypothetical protein